MSSVATAGVRRAHPPSPRPGQGLRDAIENALPAIVSLGVGAILWEVAARVWDVAFFPPLSVVLGRLVEMIGDGLIIESLANSLLNLALGFGFSVVVGVGIGMLMGAYRRVDMALDVYVYALLTAPSLVFAPILLAVFGIDGIRFAVIGVIVLYSIFIIIVNTTAAIKGTSPALIEMGRAYCATDRQLFRRIILPAALPLIFAGLRLGMARAVKGMINGEMFIAVVGLGAVVQNSGKRFDAASVLAVLIVIIVVAMVLVKLVQLLDARATSWLPSTARTRRRRGT